jgi:hypothetical protein
MRPTSSSAPATASDFIDEDTLPSVDADDLEDVLGGCHKKRRSCSYECTVVQQPAAAPVQQVQPDRRRMMLPLLLMMSSSGR